MKMQFVLSRLGHTDTVQTIPYTKHKCGKNPEHRTEFVIFSIT